MSPISDLADHMGYWLRMVSNAVSQDFARRLAAQDVTVSEWAALRMLYGCETMSPSLLAAKMGMTKGGISKLADRLLEKRLIERIDDCADRRAHHLSLTGAGREKVPILAALADSNDAEHFGALPPAEHAALRHILALLVERHGLSGIPLD